MNTVFNFTMNSFCPNKNILAMVLLSILCGGKTSNLVLLAVFCIVQFCDNLVIVGFYFEGLRLWRYIFSYFV